MKRHTNILGTLVLVVVVPIGAFAADKRDVPSTGPVDRRLTPFDKLMIEFLEAHPALPGATLAVARDGKLVYDRGFGHAEGMTLMKPSAKFRIASISKPITAVAILQLIERGKLKMDSKVFAVLDLDGLKKRAFSIRAFRRSSHHRAPFAPHWRLGPR